MEQWLNRVAVLGAGTMGAQISAHFANVGVRSLLLDLPAPDGDRSLIARQALARLSSLRPSPLYSPDKAGLIEVGNFDQHLEALAECQWILECVVEKLDIKRQLWERVEEHWRPGSILSTNTSGLPVHQIAEGRSQEFRKHFLGVHFFNPPRYMKLLEVIPTADTHPDVLQRVTTLGDRPLGKGIVVAKDRPNFIANRIGSFVAARSFQLMEELDLTVEEVDTLTGPVIGFPKTGTFRLADLVGVDVLLDVIANLHRNLEEDSWRDVFAPPRVLTRLAESGLKGIKTGGGFYRKDGGQIRVLDLATLQYRERRPPQIPSVEMVRNEMDGIKRVKALMGGQDKSGRFLWPLFRDVFLYSAERIPEVAEDYAEIDRAMRWGFNWQWGPFELWQALGMDEICARISSENKELPDWVQALSQHPEKEFYPIRNGRPCVFDLGAREFRNVPQEPGKISLALLKKLERVVRSNPGASLIDLGDDVLCLEFHGKMNTIGPDVVNMARQAVEETQRNYAGLVIANQGENFSVGANLLLLLLEAQEQNWEDVDLMVRAFQEMTMAFRYSARPVVAAPFHRVLGGGCEVCLGCDAMVAAAECYMGLVEVGVGLIPAGGGTKELLRRHIRSSCSGPGADLLPALKRVFYTIGKAEVSSSGEGARSLGFLQPGDVVEVNSDRLVARAKSKVLHLADGYAPPQLDADIPVMGSSGLSVLKVGIHLMQEAGHITAHDALVGRKLAYVLTGGDLNHPVTVSEGYLLDLEREAFLSLCGEIRTLERIQHTLKTGRPLRN